MKVSGPRGVHSQAGSQGARAEGGFSLAGAGGAMAATAAAPMAGASGVGSLAALLALQQGDTAEERRRRSIRRGGGLLDRLDALKIALLDGGDPGSALQALSRAASEARETEDDLGLKDVLDHIETRAAVELAKARMR